LRRASDDNCIAELCYHAKLTHQLKRLGLDFTYLSIQTLQSIFVYSLANYCSGVVLTVFVLARDYLPSHAHRMMFTQRGHFVDNVDEDDGNHSAVFAISRPLRHSTHYTAQLRAIKVLNTFLLMTIPSACLFQKIMKIIDLVKFYAHVIDLGCYFRI
jgi:hypothetical protein